MKLLLSSKHYFWGTALVLLNIAGRAQSADSLWKVMMQTCLQVKNGHYVSEKQFKPLTVKDIQSTIQEVYFCNTGNSRLNPYSASIHEKELKQITFIDSSGRVLKYQTRDSSQRELYFSNSGAYDDYLFDFYINLHTRNSLRKSLQRTLSINDSSYVFTRQFRDSVQFWGWYDGYTRVHINKKSLLPFYHELLVVIERDTQILNERILWASFNLPDIERKVFYDSSLYVKKNVLIPASTTLTPIKKLEAGDTFPAFLARLPGQGDYILATDSTKLLLIDFWYISCAPCIFMSKALKQLQDRNPRAPFRIIGINPKDSAQQILSWLEKHPVPYKNYMDTDKLAETFALHAYPRLYVLDRNRKILEIIEGYAPDIAQRLERWIAHD